MEGPEIIPIVDENSGTAKHHHPNLPDVGVGVKGAGECLLMISPRQTGKCLYEYSLVETEEGNKYIKNVKVGDKVLSDSGFVEVDKVFKQGKKKCFRIISENGHELILTEDHKLHTLEGMKPMRECDNEMIITKTGMTKIKSKEYYGEVECYDISVKNENHRFYCNFFSVSNSTIISSLFLNDNFYGQDFFPGGVVVISPTINMDSTSRFMKKRFECHDTYSPELIQNIIQRQTAKGDDDPTKEIALVLDDCVGMLDSNVANLVTGAGTTE